MTVRMVVTDGDLFDEKSTIKYVFIDGKPVDISEPAHPGQRRAER